MQWRGWLIVRSKCYVLEIVMRDDYTFEMIMQMR